MKTIKQISKELGVTKQAVFYRIKRPPLSNALQSLTSKIDGVLMVSFDGETLIKQAFEQVTVKQDHQTLDGLFDDVFDGSSTKSGQVDSEIIKLLQKNIEVLQSQLEAKDRQIEDLTSALVISQQTAAAAQALHAGTMNHLAVSDEKKPGVFSRLFGKK